MPNPKWHRDEIILALDLYFDTERGSIDSHNPKIVELSRVLNSLPLFPHRPDEQKFRNPNGVTLKLSNFLALDPNYHGKGMESYSKLDRLVFVEFEKDRDRLKSIAREIKKVANNVSLKEDVYSIEDDEVTNADSVSEGLILYKIHKVRERNKSIVNQKKNHALAQFGRLECEACVFDFERFYGSLGKGFIECHHKAPLSSLNVESKTSLDDLALVCPNCHRMLHRSIDTLTLEDLKMKIAYRR